eukprot:scaffold4207_cov63-Phaeocystis_antarctica.AAC.2
MAYVLAPMTKVATPCAPLSSSKPFTPSVALPTARGLLRKSGGGGGGGEGGGAAGGTIPANRASSARLMPSAVRKSAARSSPEHVSFPSATPVHLNASTPSTLVLNEMAVWRPEMRTSFAVAGSGGQARGGDTGGGAVGGSGAGGGGDGSASPSRRAAVVSAASTGMGRAWGGGGGLSRAMLILTSRASTRVFRALASAALIR